MIPDNWKVDWRVEVDGRDRSTNMRPFLLDIDIVDKDGTSSDTCNLTFDDTDGQVLLPPNGARLAVWLQGVQRFAGTVDTLVKPENKATLTKILTYHVVPGRLTASNLMKAVKDGNGKAMFKTVAGETITIEQAGPGRLWVTDAKGGKSTVTIADVLQSNGVIHVVDTVLLPG